MLVVAGVVSVLANVLIGLLWRGTLRLVDRLEEDVLLAEDPLPKAVLLEYRSGRRPADAVALAASLRQRAGFPCREGIPPDPVVRDLDRWFRKRVPGWSRRYGLGGWTTVLTVAFVTAWIAYLVVVGVLLVQLGGPDPVWDLGGGNGAIVFWLVCGFLGLAVLHVLLWKGIDGSWGIMRGRCYDVVHRELGECYDEFVRETGGPALRPRASR